MKTEEEIQDKINEIQSDERFNYEPANVLTNAPLALIQTDMEAKFKALNWVLGKTENLII